jgi:hypothetical protein
MSGYIINIEEATTKNESYREVLFTTRHTQLVLMSLKPGEEIGEEVYDLDQFTASKPLKARDPRRYDSFRR